MTDTDRLVRLAFAALGGAADGVRIGATDTFQRTPERRGNAAVIGIADEKWGQHLRAVIVLSDGHKVSAEDIIGFCQGRIASYKIPKDIIFISALPRTANGKVSKAALLNLPPGP